MPRPSSSPRRRAAAATGAPSESGSVGAASGAWAAVSAPAWACPWAAWWAAAAVVAEARAGTPSRPSPSTRRGSAPGGSESSSKAWTPSTSSSAPPRTLGEGPQLELSGGPRPTRDEDRVNSPSEPPRRFGCAKLLLPPYVLHATEVEDVVVRDHVLHVRPHREVVEALIQGGPGRVQLELLLHRHHEGEPLRGIQLHRLLVDQLHHLLVAVEAVVARRTAGEILVEVGVRIVHPEAGEVGADLVVAAGGHGMPLRRLDLLQGRLDAHLLQLVDHEGRHVHVDGDGARDHLHAKRLARPVACLGEELPRLVLHVGGLTVSGEGGEVAIEHAPHAVGLGHHGHC